MTSCLFLGIIVSLASTYNLQIQKVGMRHILHPNGKTSSMATSVVRGRGSTNNIIEISPRMSINAHHWSSLYLIHSPHCFQLQTIYIIHQHVQSSCWSMTSDWAIFNEAILSGWMIYHWPGNILQWDYYKLAINYTKPILQDSWFHTVHVWSHVILGACHATFAHPAAEILSSPFKSPTHCWNRVGCRSKFSSSWLQRWRISTISTMMKTVKLSLKIDIFR